MRLVHVVFALAATALPASAVQAQTAEEYVAQVRAVLPDGGVNPLALASVLIRNGSPREACILIDVVFGANTTDADALGLLGDCHLMQGNLALAARYYERAAAQRPDSSDLRTKAQLASTALHAMTGPAAHAEAEDQLAQAALPAPRVSGSVGISRVYDSNANGGTTTDTFQALVGGAPLTLTVSGASKAASSWGTRIHGGLSNLNPLDRHYASVFGIDLAATLYDTMPGASRVQAGVFAGVLYADDRVQAALAPRLQAVWTGGALDQVVVSADGRALYALDERLSLTGNIAAGYGWAADSNQSAADLALASGIQYHLAPGVTVGAQVVVRRSSAANAVYSFTSVGPELYLDAVLAEGVRAHASYSWTGAVYDAASAAFPQGRQDSRHALAAELNFDIATVPGATLGLRYDYSRTDSSIDFNDADRHVVSVGLGYKF